jgi:hypothetical protein
MISCLNYYAATKTETKHYSETSDDFEWTTKGYTLEDGFIHNRRCDNHNSCSFLSFLFNDALSRTDYTASKYRYVGEKTSMV